MELVLALLLVVGVLVVRELVRWAVHGGRPRLRAVVDLRGPGSPARRAVAIVAGFATTYLAVSALAYVLVTVYGLPGGLARYGVGTVLPDSAAVGKLVEGDRIDAVDGEVLFVNHGPSLVDRVNAKAGAPVELGVLRDGKRETIHITPRTFENDGKTMWLLGIRPVVVLARAPRGIGYALAAPAKQVGSDIRELAGERVEVGGVVRIVDELSRLQRPVGERALRSAFRFATSLAVLLLVLDLIRLALVFRDRLRA